jgi:hypothetical protein
MKRQIGDSGTFHRYLNGNRRTVFRVTIYAVTSWTRGVNTSREAIDGEPNKNLWNAGLFESETGASPSVFSKQYSRHLHSECM